MLVYLISFAIGLFALSLAKAHADNEAVAYRRPNKGVMFVAFLVAFLALEIPAALRFDVGTDYMFRYVTDYDNLILYGIEPQQEWIYIQFYHVLVGSGVSFQWFFVVTSALINGFVLFALSQDKHRQYPLAFAVFFLHCMYFNSLSNIRQCLCSGAGIAAFAILWNWDRKKKKTYIIPLILLGLSALFHPTGLVYLPVFVFFLIPWDNKKMAVVLVLAAVLAIPAATFGVSLLKATKYAYFFSVKVDYGAGRIQLFFMIPEIVTALLALYQIFIKKNPDRRLLIPLVFFVGAMVAYAGAKAVRSNELFLRLYHIVNWFYLLYLPMVISCFEASSYRSAKSKAVLAGPNHKIYYHDHRMYVAPASLSERKVVQRIRFLETSTLSVPTTASRVLTVGFVLIGLAMFYVQAIWTPLYGAFPYQTIFG